MNNTTKKLDQLKLTSNENLSWREIAPREWSTKHHVQYMKELGLDEVYLNFYNSSFVEKNEPPCEVIGLAGTGWSNGKEYEKKSLGFRACSVDRSYAWALETKFLKHRCKLKIHTGQKHSELSTDYPVASWVCPETGDVSTSPLRWKEYKKWIPIDFKSREDILRMGGFARTWFWELSLYHNNYRDMELYPVKAIGKKITAEEYDLQWTRVISHPFILEIDASKEDNTKGRRDLLSKTKYLESGNDMIYKINKHLTDEMHISDVNLEWWFSGNGLYCILNPWLNSFMGLRYKEGISEKLNDYFKKQLAYWNNHTDKLMEKLNKQIKYLKIDNKPQHLRSYIKTPFSLHQDYDRPCVPLSCLFGGNEKIDLTSSLFLEVMDVRNLKKEIIEKYFLCEEKGIKINNFLKVNRI